MSDSTNHIILNGELVAENIATVPAVTSGLYYGAGAFETFLSERGNIFRFGDHIERLNAGLNYLGVPKNKRIESDLVLAQLNELLKKNNLLKQNARIRMQVSLAERSGYSRSDDLSLISVISATPLKNKKKVQTLILSETGVVSTSARPAHYKLSNMLHYRHAFREAEQRGADDAVLLNSNGFVAEASIANIFWMKNDQIYTPSQECDILPGIMRNSILSVLRDAMQLEVKEGRFSLGELMEAEAVWLTNSMIDFIPVALIENVSFKTDPRFFSDLEDQLLLYKEANMTNA